MSYSESTHVSKKLKVNDSTLLEMKQSPNDSAEEDVIELKHKDIHRIQANTSTTVMKTSTSEATSNISPIKSTKLKESEMDTLGSIHLESIGIPDFDNLFLDPEDTSIFVPMENKANTANIPSPADIFQESIDLNHYNSNVQKKQTSCGQIEKFDDITNINEIDQEIDQALAMALNEITESEGTFNSNLGFNPVFNNNKIHEFHSLSPESISSFDSPITPNNESSVSITSAEDDVYIKQEINNDPKMKAKRSNVLQIQKSSHSQNIEEGSYLQDNFITSNILSVKKQLVNSSRIISTFTVLKTTYLKLCKEFNYLLEKFNNNEKIKFELINENNELRKLINELINERNGVNAFGNDNNKNYATTKH